jgi:hypothetical protein
MVAYTKDDTRAAPHVCGSTKQWAAPCTRGIYPAPLVVPAPQESSQLGLASQGMRASRLVNAKISERCGPHPYVLRSTVRLRAEGRSVRAVLYLQKRTDQG